MDVRCFPPVKHPLGSQVTSLMAFTYLVSSEMVFKLIGEAIEYDRVREVFLIHCNQRVSEQFVQKLRG